ncbi:MAG: endonuclease/exonuclease/phosphatase family protein [Planctomycetaceae bacterium]
MSLFGSALMGGFLVLLYRKQPDWAAALTVIPAWCWIVAASGLLFASKSAFWSISWWLCLLSAILFAVLQVEQTYSLARGMFRLPPRETTPDRPWRIVSLNCHVGTSATVVDLKRWQPDVVLLQESPSQAGLTQIARELFGDAGSYVSTGDCSIVADGPLEPVPTDRLSRFVQARWSPRTGGRVMVFSLRLPPPSTRLDLWRPACWQSHRHRREIHRQHLDALAAAVAAVPVGMPVIVGGDFNSPADDAAQRPLTKQLQDSFDSAGRGWGQTFSRRFPFHRIDRIWLSSQLTPLRCGAMVSEHSDHRAAVCDAQLSPTPTMLVRSSSRSFNARIISLATASGPPPLWTANTADQFSPPLPPTPN